MKTAKALGYKKGDFVFTGYFPGIIVGDVHTFTPTVEAWGIEHEIGSCYANDLRRMSPEEWREQVKAQGYQTIEPSTEIARKALEGTR